MAPQYAMQGWQALGGNLSGLGEWFPRIDAAAWALRALIEAWALIYLFSTPARDDRQARLLAVFEVALICLIVVTLGPALAAAGSNQSMKDYLGGWYSAWNFAVASYAPLMLGAAGFAFKVESQAAEIAEAASEAPMQPIKQAIEKPAKVTTKRQKSDNRNDKTNAKALQILADNPEISGSDLGRAVGKSASRGRQLKAELLPEISGNRNGNGANS
jgi:hypothetical protein